MSVRTDVINLNVNVNGNAALNQLNDLKKSAADIKFEMQGMKKGTQEYIDASNRLKSVTGEIDSLKQKIGLSALSMKDLNNEAKRLSSLKNSVTPLSDEWKKYDAELQKVKARQQEVNSATQSFKQAAGEAGTSFGKIFTHVAEAFTAYRIIDEIAEKIKSFFTGSIHEADQAEESTAKLRIALENAGRVDVFARLNEQAEQFAQTYKSLDNDDIKNVFTKLIDYGKLTEKQITSLTDVIINFAAKQRISLEDATDVITKGLEGNGKAVKTYGIDLKDASTVTERFGIIMGQLGTKVKGAQEALEETNKGVLERFAQKYRDVQEAVGNFIYSLVGVKDKTLENAAAAKEDATQAQALVDRYTELSKKTTQTASDKAELQKITTSLAAKFGDSVVEINKETGALQLNVSATQDLIKQKLLLANEKAAEVASQYNAALEDYNQNANDASVALQVLREKQKEYNISAEETVKLQELFNNPNAAAKVNSLTDEEKEVVKLKYAYDDATKTLVQHSDKIGELSKQLKQLGFSASDVDKLFHPQTGGVIGNGNPDANPEAEKQFAKTKKDAQDLVKTINDLFKQMSEDPYLYQLGKIFQEREDHVKKLNDALKAGAISQQQYDVATDELNKILNTKIQNLTNTVKLQKPKPIPIEFQPHLDFLDNGEIDAIGKQIKEHLALEAREGLASAQLKVIYAKNGAERLKATLEELEKEKQAELDSKEHTESEKQLIEEKYREKSAEAIDDWKKRYLAVISQILDWASQAIDVWSKFNAAKSAKENAALNKELKANDLLKAAYKKQLDGKLLSQAQYDKKVEELDADAAKKKDELAKKQFERDKKNQIAQAIASGAQGIVSTLAAKPGAADIIGLGLFRAIQIGLVVATTAAQVAAISKTQYESGNYAKGGKLEGPSHADGGIQLGNDKTGTYYGEAEGDEAIINKGVLKDKKTYSMTGTPSQIASAINGLNGGNTWEQGAVVQMPAWRMQKPAQINPNMPRIMEQGGIVRPIANTQQSNSSSQSEAALLEMKNELSLLREDMQTWKTKLHAVVSIKEYREEERKYDAAKKVSGIAQ